MRAPRILIVTPTYTHPQDQGNSARIYATGKQLQAAGCVVDILFYTMDWPGDQAVAQMRACWNRVHLLQSGPVRPSFATCWGLDDWCSDLLVEKVAELQASHRYDAVIVNYVWLSRAFEGAGDALRILDTHDLFGDRHWLARRSGLLPNWYFTTLAEENRGFDRADIVLAIQSDEMQQIRARTKSEVMLLSHPADLPHPDLLRKRRGQTAGFGYIGSANPWNQIAVTGLDAALAGRGLDWLLAGRISELPLPLASAPFILGKVGGVADFYALVECTLNPMPDATGLKIKTIESLAYDTPVIGTTAAFAGLDPAHACHRCTSVDDIADAASAFAASPALKVELQEAGRQLFFRYLAGVEEQYSAFTGRIGLAAGSARGV